MACRSRLFSIAIWTASSAVNFRCSKARSCAAASLSSSVPLFHTIVIAERSSTAALTSGNPALRFTDAQPVRPKQQKRHPADPLRRHRIGPVPVTGASRSRRSPGAAHRS